MEHQGGISGSRERSQSSLSPPVGFDPGRRDFTIADVLAWARTKPADERYNFSDIRNCALCQFMRDTGVPFDGSVGGTYWQGPDGTIHEFVDGLGTALVQYGHTFGELANRLEALCPETHLTKSDWLAIDAYMAREQVSA